MSSSITLLTTSGRVIHGINFSINTTTLPSSIPALAANMQGQMPYGSYHVYTASGWQYIPANQIAAVLNVKVGAPT